MSEAQLEEMSPIDYVVLEWKGEPATDWRVIMPGLLRGVARTAVVAGTATAVSNRVSR